MPHMLHIMKVEGTNMKYTEVGEEDRCSHKDPRNKPLLSRLSKP